MTSPHQIGVRRDGMDGDTALFTIIVTDTNNVTVMTIPFSVVFVGFGGVEPDTGFYRTGHYGMADYELAKIQGLLFDCPPGWSFVESPEGGAKIIEGIAKLIMLGPERANQASDLVLALNDWTFNRI